MFAFTFNNQSGRRLARCAFGGGGGGRDGNGDEGCFPGGIVTSVGNSGSEDKANDSIVCAERGEDNTGGGGGSGGGSGRGSVEVSSAFLVVFFVSSALEV